MGVNTETPYAERPPQFLNAGQLSMLLCAQRPLVLMRLIGREKAPRISRPGSADTDPIPGHGDEPDGCGTQDPDLAWVPSASVMLVNGPAER